MEAQTSLVRAYGIVVLHTVTHVCLHVAFVVDPRHAEFHEAVGNAQTLYKVGFLKFRMFVVLVFMVPNTWLTACMYSGSLGNLLLRFSTTSVALISFLLVI